MKRKGIRSYLKQHSSDAGFESRGLPKPTRAVPGSSEKIEVLAVRLDQGFDLHHPDDTQVTLPRTMQRRLLAICAPLRRRYHSSDIERY